MAILALALVLSSLLCFTFIKGVPYYMRNHYKAAAPALPQGQFAPMPTLGEVDFTVPADGSIEQVRDKIRAARADGETRRFTVLIEDGAYGVTQLAFDERDQGTTYRSRDGAAVLNGGMALDPKDFTPWEKNANIQVIDLAKLGLEPEDWGGLFSFGGFTTAEKYDNGTGPLACELFFNGRRMTTARYPNGGAWLEIEEVIDNGDAIELYEDGKTIRSEAWASLRNPRGGVFAMDRATAKRAAGWAPSGDIWVFGCFKWDWADMSTRVKAIEGNALHTEYASLYGFATGGTYYFYNVLEELDAPGEWYLDRQAGLLYFWPPEDAEFSSAGIDLSLSTETLITGEGVKDLSFIGLTFQGTRGDGIRLSGDNLLVDHCVLQGLAGTGITLEGSGNTASDNTIRHVGKEGIVLDGGDEESLTPGGSKAVNNLVHDWSEVVMTYQGGIRVNGTGNIAAHNELYNSPHTAIFFSGNNHVIEHNVIHDVCLETSDAGAIYNGRSWYSAWGSVIRSNVIYNIGSGEHKPDAIYLDDGLAGVTVENNLLVNIPKFGLHFSGRDLTARGNIVVNAGRPVSYDQRTRNGAVTDDPNFWFYAHSGKGGDMWQRLEDSFWQTDAWKAAFPKLAAYKTDFADIEDPLFAANPADSAVAGNVYIGPNEPHYEESVLRFSSIGPNESIGMLKGRAYWELPGYENIEVERVGRRGE